VVLEPWEAASTEVREAEEEEMAFLAMAVPERQDKDSTAVTDSVLGLSACARLAAAAALLKMETPLHPR
jgi:hypothetical protein